MVCRTRNIHERPKRENGQGELLKVYRDRRESQRIVTRGRIYNVLHWGGNLFFFFLCCQLKPCVT